jgi:hypothetical protein
MFTEYNDVLNIHVTQNTAALHHNKTPHLAQETKECLKNGIPTERGTRFWHYFANKRRLLGRYSSLADQSHGV